MLDHRHLQAATIRKYPMKVPYAVEANLVKSAGKSNSPSAAESAIRGRTESLRSPTTNLAHLYFFVPLQSILLARPHTAEYERRFTNVAPVPQR